MCVETSPNESYVELRLRDLGFYLPDLAPTNEFLPTVTLGDTIYISGHDRQDVAPGSLEKKDFEHINHMSCKL